MVTLLAVLWAFFAGSQALKLILTLREWSFQQSLPLMVSPLYLAIKGGAWSAVGFALAWGLWTGRSWARVSVLAAGGLFALQYWVEWVCFTASDITRVGWPFALVLTLLGAGSLAGAALVPSSRRYFSSCSKPKKNYDRSIKKPAN